MLVFSNSQSFCECTFLFRCCLAASKFCFEFVESTSPCRKVYFAFVCVFWGSSILRCCFRDTTRE